MDDEAEQRLQEAWAQGHAERLRRKAVDAAECYGVHVQRAHIDKEVIDADVSAVVKAWLAIGSPRHTV